MIERFTILNMQKCQPSSQEPVDTVVEGDDEGKNMPAVEGDGDSESNDESSDEESVSSEEPVNTALEDNDSEGAETTEESDLDDSDDACPLT